MFPLIPFKEIAESTGLTINHIYQAHKGRRGFHKKHNKKLSKYYKAKGKEIQDFIDSLEMV